MLGLDVRSERGEVMISTLAAIMLTFVFVVGMVVTLTFLYGQSALRSALDEGVLAGSRIQADSGGANLALARSTCQVRGNQAIADLLSPGFGAVTLTCNHQGPDLVAVGDATFTSPLPFVPTWTVHLEARGVQEVPAEAVP